MNAFQASIPFWQRPILNRLDRASQALLQPDGGVTVDFARPHGEPALAANGADSMSWRVFKNPVALFIGGVAAVILELAEPRVRSGVWEHSGFRTDPVRRLRRTGLAAMVTVYGARSVAERMIGGIRSMHDRVKGRTPSGAAYAANDPALLSWVHATAAFGFMQAYHAYAAPLRPACHDRYYGEGRLAAQLYGVETPVTSAAEMDRLFSQTLDQAEPSPIIFEFLHIMRSAPVLPPLLRPLQSVLVRAAISLTPVAFRDRLGLRDSDGLSQLQRIIVRRAGAAADRIVLESSPAVQACLRLGLPADYLYRRHSTAPLK